MKRILFIILSMSFSLNLLSSDLKVYRDGDVIDLTRDDLLAFKNTSVLGLYYPSIVAQTNSEKAKVKIEFASGKTRTFKNDDDIMSFFYLVKKEVCQEVSGSDKIICNGDRIRFRQWSSGLNTNYGLIVGIQIKQEQKSSIDSLTSRSERHVLIYREVTDSYTDVPISFVESLD